MGEPFLKISAFWTRLRRRLHFGTFLSGWSSWPEVFDVHRLTPQGGDLGRWTGLTLAAWFWFRWHFAKIFKKLHCGNKPCATFYERGAVVFPPFLHGSASGSRRSKVCFFGGWVLWAALPHLL